MCLNWFLEAASALSHQLQFALGRGYQEEVSMASLLS
jgi:hypothetical protein